MPRYSDASRERVRDAVDFVELVSQRVELRRAGADRMTGLCPFHEERSPSFGISPRAKLFHCFGCGEGGDVFRYVMLTEGLDFGAALEDLAKRAGVQLEPVEEDPRQAERRRERERLHELLERAAAYYVRVLWQSEEARSAREYLAARGLEEATLREYRVGFAPRAGEALVRAAAKGGFGIDEAERAGLVRRSDRGPYDFFRGRITFPITDARGRVLGFGARSMEEPPRGGKYVNTPEGPLFSKRRVLFGSDLARSAAAKAGEVVVAEGYTDVLMLAQAGLRHAVCAMGTSVTEEQVGELARLAPRVLLAMDADSAGQEAMLRAARVAAKAKLELRVVPLPAGLDPADLVAQQGADAVRAVVGDSVPFVRFHVRHVLDAADLSSAEGKDAAIAVLRPVFAELPPSATREDLIGMVADRLSLAPTLVGSWLAGDAGRAGPSGPSGGPAPRGATAPPPGRTRPAPAPRTGAGGGAPPDATRRAERAFLAQCLALPRDGAARLAALDLEQAFAEDLTRRAAVLVREHPDDPAAAVPADEADLARLMAQLVVRAGELAPSTAGLEAEALKLELVHVERDLARGGPGTAELVARREDLRRRLGDAIAAALEDGPAA